MNESFVRKFASGRNPIGVTLTLYPHTARALGPIEVVGVVGDAVYSSLRGPVPPTFYMTLAQFDYLTELGIREINLSYRSHTESPIQLTRSIATAITSVDPQLSLTFSPLLGQVNAALTQERVVAQLSGFFGVLALLLAGLGLFGVTAQSVASRRTEIGIRMALGATPGRITLLTLRRAYIPVGVGVAVGAGLSLAGAKFGTVVTLWNRTTGCSNPGGVDRGAGDCRGHCRVVPDTPRRSNESSHRAAGVAVRGQTGSDRGQDRGQTGVRPGSNRGLTPVLPP